MAKRCQEGQRVPFAERRAGRQLCPAWCPAPDRRHIRLGSGLVDEDEAVKIKPPLILLPLRPPARDLRRNCSTATAFFLNVTPASRTIRQTDP